MWQLLCRNPGQRASLEMREVFLELSAVAFQPVSRRKASCVLDSYFEVQSCNSFHSWSVSTNHLPSL